MQLFTLSLLLAILWAAIQLWLLPRIKLDWQARDLSGKMARAGALTVMEKLGELAAIGTLTILAVALLVAACGLIANNSVPVPQIMLKGVAPVYDGLKAFSTNYGIAVGWLGAMGGAIALWISASRARKRVAEVWQQKAAEEHIAILDDPSILEEMRHNPELSPLVERIETVLLHLQDQGEDGADAEVRQKLEAHLNDMLVALAIERARKSVDFPGIIEETPEPDGLAGEPERPKGWRRLLAIVSSKKFSEDAGLARKPLGRAVTALLFATLIGWSSAPLANSMRLTINNLRVQIAANEAQQGLDQALSRKPDSQETDEAENNSPSSNAAATRAIARVIVQQMARSPLLTDSAGLPHQADNETLRGLLAEDTIAPAEATDDLATQVRREAAIAADTPGTTRPGATQLYVEQKIAPIVERLGRERPGMVAAMLARIDERYGVQMSVSDARAKVTERMLDAAFNFADAKPQGQLGIQAQKLSKDFGKKALQTWVDVTMRDMMTSLVTRSTQPMVHRAVAMEVSDDTRRFVTDLQDPARTAWRSSASVVEERQIASKVADAIVMEANPGLSDVDRRQAGQMLAGYDAVFPSSPEPGSAPDFTPPPASGGEGGGGWSPGGGGEGGGKSVHASARGGRYGNFGVAMRSFRARGVVIGRPLDGRLNATDVRWTFLPSKKRGAATRVALELALADAGSTGAVWRSLGSFDAGTLNQAIRYAADGRVIATTIVPGDGKRIGRLTYLHPALVDTPLGCRVVEADRWVDTFTRVPVKPWSDRNETWLWLGRVDIAERVASDASLCSSSKLSAALSDPRMREPHFSPSYGKMLGDFLSRLDNPRGSGRFVAAASRCAGAAGGKALQCLCGNGRAQELASLPHQYWFPEDHTSQVRERPARLTPDLRWMQASPDRLGSLDFWVHTTFSLRSDGEGNEQRTVAFDFPVPALLSLRGLTQRQLKLHLPLVMRARSYEDFMRPLEEFVLAQRFVRAVLDKRLGPNFPDAKLVQLSKLTRKYVPSQPTIRWDADNPAQLQSFLERTDPQAGRRNALYVNDYTSREASRRAVCDASSL